MTEGSKQGLATRKQGLATRSIHSHRLKDKHGSPHLPVYDTTTFAFASTADLVDVVDGYKAGSLGNRIPRFARPCRSPA